MLITSSSTLTKYKARLFSSREVIIARYGGILDQSERAHLYNNRCNYTKYIFIFEITCGYRAGHLSLYSICLLLAEFEVRVVSYGLSFSSRICMSLARSARAINPSGRNEVPKLTVWTELTSLVTVIYYALYISELR